MDLSEATRLYQSLLEVYRTHPESEEVWRELCQAREEMQLAWLEHTASLTD